jgi:hypothetical protein
VPEQVPAVLLRAFEADHRPVRPLAPPWRRAVALAPVAALGLLAAPLYWGWRSNLAELGPGLAFGLSALQALVGLVVIGAAFREAIPGRNLSRLALLSAVGAGLVVVTGVTLATAARVPVAVPADRWALWVLECLGMAALTGVPLVAAPAWAAARALPTRPALTGALYGFGAGLVADSGVRLFCWVSDPIHVLVSHGGALLGLAAAGAVSALAIDAARTARRKLRR